MLYVCQKNPSKTGAWLYDSSAKLFISSLLFSKLRNKLSWRQTSFLMIWHLSFQPCLHSLSDLHLIFQWLQICIQFICKDLPSLENKNIGYLIKSEFSDKHNEGHFLVWVYPYVTCCFLPFSIAMLSHLPLWPALASLGFNSITTFWSASVLHTSFHQSWMNQISLLSAHTIIVIFWVFLYQWESLDRDNVSLCLCIVTASWW